jgi:hypothetical protein
LSITIVLTLKDNMRSSAAKFLGPLIVLLNLAFIAPKTDWRDDQIIHQTHWELQKDKSDIAVYSQYVTLRDGFKTRRLKGVFEVNGSLSTVATYLRDGDNLQNWMQGALSSRTLIPGTNNWIHYIQFELPWPFDDQDCVVAFEPQISTEDQKIISFSSLPTVLSPQKGFNRMEHFYGYWKLKKNGNFTLVEYTAYTKSERLVPAFIQDPIVLNSFWNSMHTFQLEMDNSIR